jgi:hypothetical protein
LIPLGQIITHGHLTVGEEVEYLHGNAMLPLGRARVVKVETNPMQVAISKNGAPADFVDNNDVKYYLERII